MLKGFIFKRGQFWFSLGAFDYAEIASFYKPLTFKARLAFAVYRYLSRRLIGFKTDMPIIIREILNQTGYGVVDAIVLNEGTPGNERTISSLFYSKKTWKFLKISTNDYSKEILRNEISFMNAHTNKEIAPRLIHSGQMEDKLWFITDFLDGQKVSPDISMVAVLDLLKEVNALAVPVQKRKDDIKLLQAWSHGDFCSWNILSVGAKLRLVDWEKAEIRSLGHDLFTFVFQQKLLLNRYRNLSVILNEFGDYFDTYFSRLSVSLWHPYLEDFLIQRVKMELISNNSHLVIKYKAILVEFYEL